MQELLQMGTAFNQILKGKKTSTSRFGWRNIEKGLLKIKMTENTDLEVTVLVTDVIFTYYGQITEEEALKEGYESLEALRTKLEDIYGEMGEVTPFTLIWFLVPVGGSENEI